MDREQFLEIVNNIGTTEDETQRRELLTQLKDNVTNIFDANETLTTENNQYKEDNEKLRSANMKLFLRVGADKTDDEIKKNQVGETGKEKEPRKFENLFNEKGGLK